MTTNEEWIAQETDSIYEPILMLLATLYGGPLPPDTGPAVRERIELGLQRALLRGARVLQGFGEAGFVASPTNRMRCERCGAAKSLHSQSLDCPQRKVVP